MSLSCIGKRGGISSQKIAHHFPEFPQGSYEEISADMIPWNSPIIARGKMGGMDGARWVKP